MRKNASRGLLASSSRTYTPAPPKKEHRVNSTSCAQLEPLDVPQQSVLNKRLRTRAQHSTAPRTVLPPPINNGMRNSYNNDNPNRPPSDAKSTGGEKSSSAKQQPVLLTTARAITHANSIRMPSINPRSKGTGVKPSSGEITDKEYPREPKRPGLQRPRVGTNTTTPGQSPPKLFHRTAFSRLPVRTPVNITSKAEVDSAEMATRKGELSTMRRKRMEARVRPLSPTQLATHPDSALNNKASLPLEMPELITKKMIPDTQVARKSISPHQQPGTHTDIKDKAGDAGSLTPLVPQPSSAEDYHDSSNWRTLEEIPDEAVSVIEGSSLEPPFSTHLWAQAHVDPSKIVSQSVGFFSTALGSESVTNGPPKGARALHCYPKQLKEGYYACARCRNPVCSPLHQVPTADLQHSRTTGYAVFSRAHAKGLRVVITNITEESSKKTSMIQNKPQVQRLKPSNSLTFSVFCRYCNACVGILESAEGRGAISIQDDGKPKEENVCEWFIVNSLCLEYIPLNTRARLDELLVCTSSHDKKKSRCGTIHLDYNNYPNSMNEEDQQALATTIASVSSLQGLILNGKDETNRLAEEWGLCLECSTSDEDIALCAY
ncbi:unnamed protein product [Phytomonas sp. Hart1]|nr:unnamed protein product [Phytomonas sp. Hart1]|eukprot:CCW70345.1 unnamed protein product [Phytomonas sp. isolate Hart1]